MSSRIWIGVCAVAIAGAFLFGGAFAQGMPMPEWMQPTKEHAAMKKYAGDWDLALTMWMMPGAPPQQMKATASSELILGGKFVQETVKGNFQGMPFEGRSTMGYDTVRKQWVMTWTDNVSPVMNIYYGTEKDGVITSHGEEPDMMTGKLKKTKITTSWQNDNQFTAVFADVTPEGDRKTMQIVYTRQGADACGCDDGCGCGCDDGCGEGCGCDDGCGCGDGCGG